MVDPDPKPYDSFANDAAMRVSSVGFIARSIAEIKQLSHTITAVTHNSPEGLKGINATAVPIVTGRLRTFYRRDGSIRRSALLPSQFHD